MAERGAPVLIVDDEPYICETLARLVRREGHKALMAHDGETALKMISSETPDLVLVDFMMPGQNGMAVLQRVREIDPDLPVVMITAYADIHGAVEAMRAGAHDYLAKPFEHHQVLRVVRRALTERDLKKRISSLSSQLLETCPLREVMGPSDLIGRLISDVNRVAKSDFTVVILGETGSGKELVARAIHSASLRSEAPFVPVDCGAIPETLFESELLGHEKGAFTGAQIRKPGKLETAKDGTLFLDEISNMPLSCQAKLLRALQEKKVYRVGGTKPFVVDVRLLVASNQDLFALAEAGSFRRDLLFRLSEFTIMIPPLRKRKEDIPYLAKRFMDITNRELKKNVQGFSSSALAAILDYDWPGNVRQLRSAIRRAVLLADDKITEEHIDLNGGVLPGLNSTSRVREISWDGSSLREILRRNTDAVERKVLVQALKYTGGNKAKAARLLQIDYKTIHTKVKQLGISRQGGSYE